MSSISINKQFILSSDSSVNHQDSGNWKGTFQSTSYSSTFVCGNIYVTLKPFLEMLTEASNNLTFNTTVHIQYTGMYQYGKCGHLPATITLSVKDGQVIPESGLTNQKVLIMNMKLSNPMMINQTIQYTTTKFTANEISGTYTTQNPNDEGTFILFPTDDVNTLSEGSSCLIS